MRTETWHFLAKVICLFNSTYEREVLFANRTICEMMFKKIGANTKELRVWCSHAKYCQSQL